MRRARDLSHQPDLYLHRIGAASGRIPSLDGIRALSILIVMLSHFVDYHVFPGGFGVLVFFVLSGFLITRLLFAEFKEHGQVSIAMFYARRMLRLYPVIAVYTIVVVLGYVLTRHTINWIEPASVLGYFANFLYAYRAIHHEGGMPFQIFWSLAIEEHFYLVFPAVFVVLGASARRLTIAMIAFCAACIAARLLLAALVPSIVQSDFIYLTELRADSIAFGVMAAAICESRAAEKFIQICDRPVVLVSALTVLLLCFAIRSAWFRETLRYTLQGAAVATLMCAVVFSRRLRLVQLVLNNPVAVWIGALSYSLYVWHYALVAPAESLLAEIPHAARSLILFIGSFAIAAASYTYLEAPFFNLRRRLGASAAIAKSRSDQPLVQSQIGS